MLMRRRRGCFLRIGKCEIGLPGICLKRKQLLGKSLCGFFGRFVGKRRKSERGEAEGRSAPGSLVLSTFYFHSGHIRH